MHHRSVQNNHDSDDKDNRYHCWVNVSENCWAIPLNCVQAEKHCKEVVWLTEKSLRYKDAHTHAHKININFNLDSGFH